MGESGGGDASRSENDVREVKDADNEDDNDEMEDEDDEGNVRKRG